MIATKSYIDVNGQIIIDGQPLQYVKLQQNLKAKPSRHRKQQVDDKVYVRSFADAAVAILFLMATFTAIALFLAWVNY